MLFLKCVLGKEMPIIVFGNSSSSYGNCNKIDTSLFVQNPY